MKSNSPVDCWASPTGRRCILTICLWQIGSESLSVPQKQIPIRVSAFLHNKRD